MPNNTSEIIHAAETLPVEQRALVVDSLLRSLNPPDPDVDARWISVAGKRLDDLRSGRVKAIPGDEVFSKIRKKFGA